MVTFRRRLSGLLVRFQPPHPFFCIVLLFCCCLLSGIANATDSQIVSVDPEYQYQNDVDLFDQTLFALYANGYLVNGENTIFGKRWVYNSTTNQITRVGDLTISQMNTLDDADKLVLSAVAQTLVRAEDTVRSIPSEISSNLDDWTNTFPAYEIQGSTNPLTGLTVPNLLALISLNQQRNLVTNFDNSLEYMNPYGFQKSLYLGDGLALLSQNQVANFNLLKQMGQNTVWDAVQFNSANELGFQNIGKNHSFGDMLAILSTNDVNFFLNLRSILTNGSLNDYHLTPDGTAETTDNYTSIFRLTQEGFLGMANLLAGTSDKKPFKPGISVFWTDRSDPLSVAERPEQYYNLFDFLSAFAERLDDPLTKLQFVLASDDDIQMKQEEKPNEDAVKDNFFGDGDGSVSTSNISDAAGLTSGAKDTFGGAGSAGDVFVVAGNQDTYSFFSEAVANDLDAVSGSAVAIQDDEWLADIPQDENGFYYSEFLSPEEYLKGK